MAFNDLKWFSTVKLQYILAGGLQTVGKIEFKSFHFCEIRYSI